MSQSTRWDDWPPEASGHADGGEDCFSDDSYSKGELVEGGQRLPAWWYKAPARAGDPRAEVVDCA